MPGAVAAPRPSGKDRPDEPLARDPPQRGPRGSAWLLLRAPAERSAAEQAEVARREAAVPDIPTAHALVQRFRRLLRERDGGAFDGWLTEAHAGPPELRAFAAGLQRDQAAVRAPIVEEWSNAVTEGKVTKLKLVKRQMYGRAGFDLLRIRVLRAA
ncbi:MAG TPA: transposase [Thermomicrobiaceae bacterium]|nr:transposase [Thermomicrobiaceae bacterium]